MIANENWFVMGEDEECPGVPCIDIHRQLETGGSASVAYARAHMDLMTTDFSITPAVEERARMIAAVPAMVRALRAVRDADKIGVEQAGFEAFAAAEFEAMRLVHAAFALMEP